MISRRAAGTSSWFGAAATNARRSASPAFVSPDFTRAQPKRYCASGSCLWFGYFVAKPSRNGRASPKRFCSARVRARWSVADGTSAWTGHPATADLRELLAPWPHHALVPSATLHLARTLAEQKRFGDALPFLEGFATKYPNHKQLPDAQYLLGWARVKSGDTKAGLADLRAFVAAAPNHELAPTARRMITETITRHGDPSELGAAYKTLMDETPPTPEGLYDAGSIAGRLARPSDQVAAWRRLRKEFPDHPLATRAALDLANAAIKRKDWKDAAAQAQAAAQSGDGGVRAEALLLAGESEVKLGRYGAAAKAFEAVGGVKDVEAGVRYRALAGLGLAREQLKDLRGALTAYESVVRGSPDATLRDWARERAQSVKSQLARPPAGDGKTGTGKEGGRS